MRHLERITYYRGYSIEETGMLSVNPKDALKYRTVIAGVETFRSTVKELKELIDEYSDNK
jgi:hypothetical protein